MLSAGCPDPRAAEDDNVKPGTRYQEEFRTFLVEARRELGRRDPADVFVVAF